MVNAVVGSWQERKADNAIELLKKRLALRARVQRDGKWQDMPAEKLVPGDIVRLRLGDIIPADVKLIEGDYLLTDESALTGESLPVEKHLSDVGYASSIVKQGEMNALVVNTASKTFFGKTAKLVEIAKTPSHFQKAISKIGDYLIFLAIGLVAIIVIVSIFRGQNILDIIQFALILTVAGIPAALPAVLSVTMAVGAIALAKKEAIVSKLVAIEEMASMDVLCSDKTGTITKNALTMGGTITKEENCCGTNIVRAVIYTRTALIERTALADQTGSYVKQVITCSDYISKKGWVLCEIFFDEGVIGNTIERPELSLMIEKAAKYCFDIIVISSWDRLARDPEKLLEISKILRDFHVAVQSANEQEMTTLRLNEFSSKSS